MANYFVAGGAGFIGSHMVRRLLRPQMRRSWSTTTSARARPWHLPEETRLPVVRGDLKDFADADAAIAGSEVVFHFAANPDIAKAATQPDIDFWEGTYLTQNLLEAMRVAGSGGSSTCPAAGSTARPATTPSPRTIAPACRSRPTGRASSPARR